MPTSRRWVGTTAPVHAIGIGGYEDHTLPPARLPLDFDYILRWVQPARGERPFTFWVAPATLAFEHAWGITGPARAAA